MSIRLDHEKLMYVKYIESIEFKNNPPSHTHKYWYRKYLESPLIADLAGIFLNIPASSAFIERYYSICGNVCKARAGNMTPKIIEARSFLKSNIKILDNLSKMR